MAAQQQTTFVQLMALAPVGDDGTTFMSRTPAWGPNKSAGFGAYGGHVYAQAAWAASQTVSREMIIHNVHGFFTLPGFSDRPFVYEVVKVSDGRTYCTRSVTVRQPVSSAVSSPHPFGTSPIWFSESSEKLELGKICFTCICSFKKDEDDDVGHQEVKDLNKQYSSVLKGMAPQDHENAPSVDAPWFYRYIRDYPLPLDFPGLDVRKVNMGAYNKDKDPLHYRQLLYYRLIGSIPASQPNLHACAYLFASDRNSLFLISNALDIADNISKMASLSHSVVFHVRSDDFAIEEEEGNPDAWFCQEAWTPRSQGGRGIHESKIWNARGLHIASTWQDGVVRRAKRPLGYEKTEPSEKLRDTKL